MGGPRDRSYGRSGSYWFYADYKYVIGEITNSTRQTLCLFGLNIFSTYDLTDQLVEAICSCTRLTKLTLEIFHMSEDHQKILAKFIRESRIWDLTLIGVTEDSHDIVIGSMANNTNLCLLKLFECYHLSDLLFEIANNMHISKLEELTMSCTYSYVLPGIDMAFKDIKNTNLRKLCIINAKGDNINYDPSHIEQILENNMNIIDIGPGYYSEMLQRNKNISNMAYKNMLTAFNYVFELHKPGGNPWRITSHRPILEIIAYKLLDDGEIQWIPAAYNQLLRSNNKQTITIYSILITGGILLGFAVIGVLYIGTKS